MPAPSTFSVVTNTLIDQSRNPGGQATASEVKPTLPVWGHPEQKIVTEVNQNECTNPQSKRDIPYAETKKTFYEATV